MLIEIIRDPDLYRAVQEEIIQTIIKGQSCSDFLDYTKLASLPLIQSIYTEVLRLHVQILVTRTSIEPVKVAGYELPKGSVLQAPTAVPHLDEEICMYILAKLLRSSLLPITQRLPIDFHKTRSRMLGSHCAFELVLNISADCLS
jgi:hypothetical protein